MLAERDAAAAWISTVNTSNDVHEQWGYTLASEAVVAAAGSWEAIKKGGQTFR